DRLTFGLAAGRLYDVEAVFPGGRRVLARSVSPGRTLDLFESPPGLRQLWLARGWARRAWLLADLRREAVKLLLALAALAAWRALAGRRFGERALARRWSLSAGLLAAYLLLAGALAGDARAWTQALQIPGFLAALALLTLLDRRLTAWRSSRHLGAYRLREPLGEGGMGVVYRARDVVSGRTVALKVLHPLRTREEEHRLRFLREAEILTRLDHPNIVRVFETGEAGGRAYICMELLTGEPLGRWIRRRGPLPPEAVREILAAAAGALGYVHERGIVHRDVKSDNLFLLEAPAAGFSWGYRVRLMDFGLARSSGAPSLTDRQALLGTLAYMPPEQIRGEALDARSDLYSLGVVGYEALTGRLPFEDGDEGGLLARIQTADPVPLRRLRPDVPADLVWAIETTLARDPAARPASARVLSERLAGSDAGWTEPDPVPPGLAGNPERYQSSEETAWRMRYQEARRRAEQGRSLEAQVLMMECLEEIRRALMDLAPEQREAYSRRHGVTEALDFMNRLSPG
ncbi:MAG TPA: serine/threonine-protein kinase, partial [Thermoanaerobaculia bacterium]|nr:serine/threonine-protein kinase [Thermoanaerobaculia bacterium]